MASGHVNRAKRPNTWLHRPSLQREESSCQLGAVHTWHVASISAAHEIRSRSEALRTCGEPAAGLGAALMTQCGHLQLLLRRSDCSPFSQTCEIPRPLPHPRTSTISKFKTRRCECCGVASVATSDSG
jgi:hypothetical protein